MEEVVMYIIISCLQVFVFFIYLKELLGMKRSFKWMILCWIGLNFINIFIRGITTSVAINGVGYMLSLVGITFWMCNGSVKRKIFLTFAYYGVNALIETILVNIAILIEHSTVEKISENATVANFLMILTQMIVFFVIQIVIRFCRRQLANEINMKNWLGTFSVSLGCCVVVFILTIDMMKHENYSIYLTSVLFILVGLNFLSYYFYFISAENNNLLMKSQIYQKQLSMYEEWNRSIQHTKKEVALFRHDMNNHFTVLSNICNNNAGIQTAELRLEEIKNYLESIGASRKYDVYEIDSGNLILDTIINVKKSYASSKGISMNVELYVPESMKCNNLDIVVLLGNLLDNAIEACDQVDIDKPRQISLKMQYKMKNIFIKIENTYNGKKDGQEGILTNETLWKTTKKECSVHGLGMQNVMEIVNKYNGNVKWKAEHGMFQIDILMYKFSA